MIDHLRENFPEETTEITDNNLQRFIEEETETANQFEIYNEDDIAVCISSIFALRPNLNDPEPKWVKEVQSNPNLTSEQKAELLSRWTEEELEEQSQND